MSPSHLFSNRRVSTPFAVAALLSLSMGRAEGFVKFRKIVLTTDFVGEGPSVGDFNNDGALDVAAGPFYWLGPNFTAKLKHSSQGQETYSVTSYAHHYMSMPAIDINGDGWDDIPYQSGATAAGYWMENPKGGTAPWQRHTITGQTGNEAVCFRALFPDGKPKLLMKNGGRMGWSEPDPAGSTRPWIFHPISASGTSQWNHGLGAGDINGDGRIDIVTAEAWYEQPASVAGDPPWSRHAVVFGTTTRGGAQMYVEDLNGDGLVDVITSLDGHGWGLVWCEQVRAGGNITFKTHTIMGDRSQESQYGAAFSQVHSMGFADLDGDGLKDIVTGKRWYAHGADKDPEPKGAPVLYAFKQVRGATGTTFQPFLLDSTAGSGCSLETRDLNGDGYPDLTINSKKGAFLFLSIDRPMVTLQARSSRQSGPAFRGYRFGTFLHGGSLFDIRGIEMELGRYPLNSRR